MGPGPLWGLQPWALGPLLCPKDRMCSQAGGELTLPAFPGELGPTLGDVLSNAGTQGHQWRPLWNLQSFLPPPRTLVSTCVDHDRVGLPGAPKA